MRFTIICRNYPQKIGLSAAYPTTVVCAYTKVVVGSIHQLRGHVYPDREGEGDGTPESYQSNSKKERLLLSYAENFQRQFRQLYGDRKTLFLRPVNECGVEVRICAHTY